MKWLWAVVLAGCSIEAELVQCGDYLCPVGTLCDTAHESCATQQQFDACTGLVENADCTANDIDGGCFDGVCIRRGCGNRIVEPTEQCDDGNERSRDGCSSDCRSDETCGNAVRDPGEDCDDGGLISKDGCDSRCLAEVGVWREVPLSLSLAPYLVADDEMQQRLVSPGDVSTWELVDDAWRVTAGTGGNARVPYFDTVRKQVVALVTMFGLDDYRAMAWTGSAWTAISGTLAGIPTAATFDRMRNQPLVLLGSSVMTFDTSGTWSAYPVQPSGPYEGMIYDPANDDLVLLRTYIAGEAYFDPTAGGSWTTRTVPFSTVSAYGLDGTTVVVVEDTKLYRRTAGGWTTSAAEDLPSQIPGGTGIVYRRGSTLVVEQGVSRCRRSGASWSCTSNPGNSDYSLVQDGDHRIRVMGGFYSWSIGETLGVRETVASSPAGFSVFSAIYSRGRKTIVATGTTPPCGPCTTETRVLGPNGWTLLESDSVNLAPFVYNPDARGIVQRRSFGPGGYEFLADDSSTWTPTTIPDAGLQYMVWDARLHHYVGLTIAPFTTFVYDFDPSDASSQWTQDEIAPNGDLTEDERAGSIVVVPESYQALEQLWERRAGIWTPRQKLPYKVDYGSSAYESATGRLWVMGWESPRTVAFVHDYTSATPLETCTDLTADVDGDGRAGCDDADCYWACDTCPPFVSCPGP